MRKDKKVKCKRQVQWHIVVRRYCGTLKQQHMVLLCKHCVVQQQRPWCLPKLIHPDLQHSGQLHIVFIEIIIKFVVEILVHLFLCYVRAFNTFHQFSVSLKIQEIVVIPADKTACGV